MRKVCVIGAGSTKYGRFDMSARELLTDACALALKDARVDPRRLEGNFIGNAFSIAEKQGHLGPLVMTALGIPEAPAYTIETACASGGSAFREAYVNVAGGFADVMMASGVEHVSHLDTITATSYFAYGSDYTYEGQNGCSFPGLYAAMARSYFQKYGATEEDLAEIAVKNHANGALNAKAHLQKKISVDDVMKSMTVASPLKLYDACPFSDGAAALVVATEEVAKELGVEPVYVLGSARAGSIAALQERADMASIPSTTVAGQRALKQAKATPADIDVLEVHDCFTIAEAMALEDLGFVKRGMGARTARDGITRRDGDIPTNPSGGLKAKGHPVGATGIGQIVELREQLLGTAGARQVPDVQKALAHNVGATGGSCAVHVLGV